MLLLLSAFVTRQFELFAMSRSACTDVCALLWGACVVQTKKHEAHMRVRLHHRLKYNGMQLPCLHFRHTVWLLDCLCCAVGCQPQSSCTQAQCGTPCPLKNLSANGHICKVTRPVLFDLRALCSAEQTLAQFFPVKRTNAAV
eukprot:8283-Heterococcus_DN1.PRE.5